MDLRSFHNVAESMKDIDVCYNLSAWMGGIQFITSHFADVMFNSTMINVNVAEACRLMNVEKVFFSSSACVYPEEKQAIPENDGLKESDAVPANPDTFYGWEKLFAEKLYRSYRENYGLNIRIARFHNIYGPHGTYKGGREKAPAALCRKVAMARDGEAIEIWGDGKQTRTFLFIDDAVDAILKLVNSSYDEPLNIGSSELISIDSLLDIIIEISGKTLRKTHNLHAPQGVRGRSSDNNLISQVLGWQPTIPYREGLERTYNWIRQMVVQDVEVLA